MYFVGFSYLISWVIAEPQKPIREIKSHDFLCPYAKGKTKQALSAKNKSSWDFGGDKNK